MATIRITHDDVLAFAGASHDHNPLHVDTAYARRTSFGRPVVYGVLGALFAMAQLPERSGALMKATIEFQGPLFEDFDYDVTVDGAGDKAKVLVRDGGRTLMKASLVFAARPAVDLPAGGARAARQSARTGEPRVGESIDAEWAPDRDTLEALAAKLRLAARGVSASHVAAMMAASYVVGMEMPGAQALFARLALTFGEDADLYVDAKATAFDERFRMLTLDVCLCGATGELRALCRPPPVGVDLARVDRALGGAAPFAGKTAVVIGGGRGLGAAIALSLARSGARVVATYASEGGAAEQLAALDDRVRVVRSDAASVADLGRVRDATATPIDVLVLSASPPVLPINIAPATAARATAFVGSSVALVVTPLAVLGASLAPDAKIVVVSSSYVDATPPDFAHYAAAKAAAEAFARAFARERGASLVVARPPRVLTDMTNTAFGAEDALRAEDVAVHVVVGADSAGAAGAVIDDFPPNVEAT